MAQYRVYLPAPKAKRMLKDRQIVLEKVTSGFDGWTNHETYDIPDNATHVNFEVSDDYIPWHLRDRNVIDAGCTFRIFLTCHNSTKTRSETVELVPEKL